MSSFIFVVPTAVVILHEVLALGVFVTAFNRLVLTDHTTIREVRLGFWALAVASVVALFSPACWGYSPQWPAIGMMGAIFLIQVTTARYWQHGVPDCFVDPKKERR